MSKMNAHTRKLTIALRRAIIGLRSLQGMTGSVTNRDARIRSIGYGIAEALGLYFPGYSPLEDAEKQLKVIWQKGSTVTESLSKKKGKK